MKWFKIYGEKWLMGSTRWELTPEERSVWNPRSQLYEWLKLEFEFQKNGGPPSLGEIFEFEDADHIRFVATAFGFKKTKIETGGIE